MNIPMSSELPDAVQKLLGLKGGAGTIKEALVGILATVTVVWLILKFLIRMRRMKS
jgi:hypothetical protein